MKKSRKAARRQTHYQKRQSKHSIRVVLYHGTSANNARSIRHTGFRASDPWSSYQGSGTLSPKRAVAVQFSKFRARLKTPIHPSSVIKVSLTHKGVKKYLRPSMLGEYAVVKRIPVRFIG